VTGLGGEGNDDHPQQIKQAEQRTHLRQIEADAVLQPVVDDVERALAWDTGHLSHYQLTLEPNTAFHSDPPALPDDDALEAIQTSCGERLEAAGYRRYEVSAWSRPGDECRHNLNYWTFGDYLGIGAGAHGKLTGADGRIVRRWKKRHPRAWALPGGDRLDGEQCLEPAEVRFEFMLNALRLRDGFEASQFDERTGRSLSATDADLAEAQRRGLIERAGSRWRATDRGWRFLNDVQALFLPVDKPA
jgi:coproporphyrinogen III oxidase-like Fe-S oxidoreductase